MAGTDSTQRRICNRDELIIALRTASELEHELCCSYLYTAFSIRRTLEDFESGSESENRVRLDQIRTWLAEILIVARQEMEHLAIATNLLAAVGGEPHFWRPNFPQPASSTLLGIPLCLDKFSKASMQRFVWYERPNYLEPSFPAPGCGFKEAVTKQSAVSSMGIETIQTLYEQINWAFQNLPATEVFVGSPDRQLGNVFGFRINVVSIQNRAEAGQAVNLILQQGEGVGEDPLSDDAHFQRYVRVLSELEQQLRMDPGFEPALPVISNPCIAKHPEGFPANLITRPETVEVMKFFNECYSTMLIILKNFFGSYSGSWVSNGPYAAETRPQLAKFYAVFFPLMTMVIRPLGEILVRMPAGDEYPGLNAGPSFEICEPLEMQYELGWYSSRLAYLAQRAEQLVPCVPERSQGRMAYIHENLTSTGLHFDQLWKQGT